MSMLPYRMAAIAVSSRLAYPEARTALAAAGRSHRLDPHAQGEAEVALEEYWAATRAVELTAATAGRTRPS